MATQIPLLTTIDPFPTRALPQQRFDAAVFQNMSQLEFMVDELDFDFIPAVNAISLEVDTKWAQTLEKAAQALESQQQAATSEANALASEQAAASSESHAATSEANAAASEAAALSYKNGAELAAQYVYVVTGIGKATVDFIGLVKPDGTIITVDSDGMITVPKATASSLGVVQADGSTITVTNGVLSAEKLKAPRKINNTDFDGSKDITTAKWGTARNITIADSDSTNTGAAVSVNGSAAVTLLLPATIKASLTGNASTATILQTTRTINGTNFNGSANITTANWGTARNITISDNDGTNTQATNSINGSANFTLKLPATIKASITGNCSGSSGSCTGNAATATQFSANKSVTLTGDVIGTASSKAGWSVATTLADSGVTANSYGNTTQQTPSHGGTFNIPYFTVDSKGRLTAAGTTTVKLPADNNTDTLVTQNVSTANENHPILLCVTKDATANQGAKTAIFASAVKVNPSTGVLTATGFSGPLTGNVTGNCSGSSGSCTGNAASATKLATARDINISDADGTNTGTKISFNGTAAGTIKLPATIKASITGNCSGSSGSCTGNSATATKATQDKNGLQIDTGYLKLTGGTLTGDFAITKGTPLVSIKNSGIQTTTYPSSGQWDSRINFLDKNGKKVGSILHRVETNRAYMVLRAFKYSIANSDDAWCDIGVGYDNSGNSYTFAPTPANGDNSTKIATTAFCTANSGRMLYANTTIYVSASGTGDGTTAAKAMSIAELQRYLATTHMNPANNTQNGQYTLTIAFVPTGSTYGTVTFDANKIPGIRYITITTSTGTATTISNYSTNAPLFDNIHVYGSPLQVTLTNIEVNSVIQSLNGARIALAGYVGAGKFYATNYGRIDCNNNCTLNIHNIGTDILFVCNEYGQMILNGNIMTINFRDQCYYNNAIFYSDSNGRIYVNYARMKFTGTQPVVACGYSGTKTATCSTAAGTAAKVGTLESGQTFSLTNGAIAYVTFSNTNTAANPTLNINGTGAKPIYFNGAAIPAKYLNKHVQYRFKYNGTQYVCENTFQRVESTSTKAYFTYGSNFNTTYNSGEWNFTGFSRNWVNGADVNSVRYGSIEQRVTTGDNTYPILFTGTANATANTNSIPYFGSGVKINPNKSSITATTFIGALTGNVTGNCSGSSGSCTGNAATATSAGKWTTKRAFTVKDSSSTNAGTAVDVDGSGAITLLLPATIKASITGNCSGSSGSCTGNSATATSSTYLTPLAASTMKADAAVLAQNKFFVEEVYNTGYPISYGNVLSVQGNAHTGAGQLLLGWSGTNGAVASLYYRNKRDVATANWSEWRQIAFTTDNVASATKATQDKNGLQIDTGYLKLAGGTLTGDLVGTDICSTGIFNRKNTTFTKGTNPSSVNYWTLNFCDKNGSSYGANCIGQFETNVSTNGVVSTYMKAMKNEASSTANCQISCIYDTANNSAYTSAPTPAVADNSTKIATTAWVRTATGNIAANAATATKATQDKNGLQIDTGYLKLTGGTLTGDVVMSKDHPILYVKNNSKTRGTAPSAAVNDVEILGRDSANKNTWGIYQIYGTDKSIFTYLITYKGTTTDNSWGGIGVGFDSSGNIYTSAPTPATADNSTKIATTAFVKAQGYITASSNITGSSGSCTGNAATATKQSSVVSTNGNYADVVNVTDGTNRVGTIRITNGNGYNEMCLGVHNESNGAPNGFIITNTNGTLTATFSGTATITKVVGALQGNVTGNCSGSSGSCTGNAANVTGTVAIGNGGTGSTTRLGALKNLTNENVGTSAKHFLTITDNWGKGGYTSVADAKTVLGLKSAAYTESSAYATSGHTHSYLPLSGGTLTGALTLKDSNGNYKKIECNEVCSGNIEMASILDFNRGDRSKDYWGRIYASDNSTFTIGLNAGPNYIMATNTFRPYTDKAASLGANSQRWNTVYASTGTIYTSDERLKQSISSFSDILLDAWEDIEFVEFKFNDSVEEKGDKARKHSGVVAQPVAKKLMSKGVNPCDYGFFCYDEWEDQYVNDVRKKEVNGETVYEEFKVLAKEAGNVYSIRYEELLCTEAAYMRRRVSRLEERIAQLEKLLNVA